MCFTKSIEKIIEIARPSIGFIDIKKPEGNGFSVSIRGTAFAVTNEHFISCYHVYKEVPQEERQYLGIAILENPGETIHKYKRHLIELIDFDEINDIALFKIKDCSINFKGLQLDDSEKIKEGNEVLYVGFPLATVFLSMKLGVTLVSNKCIISAIKRKISDKALSFIQIDKHVSSGSSGSPLFLIKTGKVIGLISGHFEKKSKSVPDVSMPEMMGIARPIGNAIKLLKKQNIRYA